MKELNDFIKEEETSKPRPVKFGEGADDQKYFDLMGEYKQLRRKDKKAADKLLDKALKLGRDGDVSSDCKLGAAYL